MAKVKSKLFKKLFDELEYYTDFLSLISLLINKTITTTQI